MNFPQELETFFKELSDNPELINRLVVTKFVHQNVETAIKNEFIKSYLASNGGSKKSELSEFQSFLDKYSICLSLNDLIQIFEIAVPKQDSIINGVVYTPDYVKEFIVNNTIQESELDINNTLCADIACGCGGFLISLAKYYKTNTTKSYEEIFREHIYGLDVTAYSIERAKILLSLLAITDGEDKKQFDFNLYKGNALEFEWFEEVKKVRENNGFDIIVGNPPYVTKRNMDSSTKGLLDQWEVTKVGNTDLYIPFFEIGLKYLADDGCLGYITVNTFYRSLNARLLRQLFQKNRNYLKIVDFGDEPLFGSRSTYSCICFLKHEKSEFIYAVSSSSEEIKSSCDLSYEAIPYKHLDYKRGWLLINGQTSKNLKKIESTGIKLGKKYKIRTGFATLSNDVYKFTPVKKDADFFYRAIKGSEYPIEKDICKPAVNPNQIKSESDLSANDEQIIFPYRRENGKAKIIKEDVLKGRFPKAYEFLELNRERLNKRDKGNGDYETWYAYGRTQSISETGIRLLYPHICKEPHFVICEEDILFYNGHAVYSDSKDELVILKKILGSSVFSYYLQYSSRNYSGDYISLSKNYVKHFGICDLSDKEREFLLTTDQKGKINSFLVDKYSLNLEEQVQV